jgi:pantetheine-phosphate adenylyltransferase
LTKFSVAATGGTFDEFHAGHLALLSKAFEVGNKIIIGVSSDEFAKSRGKKLNHTFNERVTNLHKIIREKFGAVNYEIASLDNDFGPAITLGQVDVLVASAETAKKGEMLNKIRSEYGLSPVRVVSVDMVKAQDGSPISSTRIRAGEIDATGRLLKRNDE